MAFNQSSASVASNNQTNDNWKATAFLNFYVKRADGSKAKIGAIPLKKQRKFDNALITRLQEDGAIDKMAEVLEFDFQLADNGAPVDAGF